MDRNRAIEQLRSEDQHERLTAARFFSRFARPDDRGPLLGALSVETVAWVKQALRKAIDRAEGAATPTPERDTEPEDGRIDSEEMGEAQNLADEVYAEAVEHTTQMLLHEIEPVVGALDFFAEQEIPEFSQSRAKGQIDRLKSLLGAIAGLSSAASAPSLSEFDLSNLVTRTVRGEGAQRYVPIELAGPTPLIVVGDEQLVELVLQNAIRNAVEATEDYREPSEDFPVVINWDETDVDYWIAILDEGAGPPLGVDKAFDIGSTSKEGHLGMGLAIAHQAIRSLGGSLTLEPRSREGGARLEARWPKIYGDRT